MNGAFRRNILLVGAALLLTFTACRAEMPAVPATAMPTGTIPSVTPSASSAPASLPIAAVPTETPFLPTAVPEDESPPALPRTQYYLDATLDYAARLLDVQQAVIYPNETGETLNELLFLVDANWNAEEFELLSLHWPDGSAVDNYFLDGGFLTLPLPDPLEPGQQAAVNLAYRLHIPYAASKLGYYGRQLNLCDWYPIIAAFRPGSGWLAYPPSPVGETLVYESAAYQVRLVVKNAPENLEIAASLPADREGDAYLYAGQALRSFAFSMSDAFEVLRVQTGGVEVASYFRASDHEAGMAALQAAVRSIEVFTELFGPYPQTLYSAVEGNFPDGLEFDGLAFTGREYYEWYDGTEQNYLTLITVHEAAHQWFYGQVGNDQALEPWVDEALTIYAEYLYLEEVRPGLADWWWEYRLDEFRPLYGHVDSPVFAYRSYRPYVDAVYLRGAEMMHAIRLEIGRDVFLESLRDYLFNFRNGLATGNDLIAAFERISGRSLDVILQAYFSVRQ